MPRTPKIAALAVVLLALSCRNDMPTVPAGPDFEIRDGAHSAGNRHFYFLPPLVPAQVNRHPPCHPHQPRPKRLPVAQLVKLSKRLRERFLRDVLGVLPVPQHAVGDTKRQSRRVRQPQLEFAGQVVSVRHEPPGQAVGVFMHPNSLYRTPHRAQRLEVLGLGVRVAGA